MFYVGQSLTRPYHFKFLKGWLPKNFTWFILEYFVSCISIPDETNCQLLFLFVDESLFLLNLVCLYFLIYYFFCFVIVIAFIFVFMFLINLGSKMKFKIRTRQLISRKSLRLNF